MLEWYRAGEPYEAVIADCVEICRLAARGGAREAELARKRLRCGGGT